jgi:hypothetical protein
MLTRGSTIKRLSAGANPAFPKMRQYGIRTMAAKHATMVMISNNSKGPISDMATSFSEVCVAKAEGENVDHYRNISGNGLIWRSWNQWVHPSGDGSRWLDGGEKITLLSRKSCRADPGGKKRAIGLFYGRSELYIALATDEVRQQLPGSTH